MRDVINKIHYSVRPRMIKRWYFFGESITLYDVMRYEEGLTWIDASYGNGFGDMMPFDSNTKVHTTRNKKSAEDFADELNLYYNEK